MGKRPTLSDVAKQAKVSPATVSYALNGHPAITNHTKEKVWRAAKVVGYRLGRRRETKGTRTLAFLNFTSIPHDENTEPLLREFATYLTAQRYHPMVYVVPNETNSPWEVPVLLRERQVDGILLYGVPTPQEMQAVHHLGLPFVVLGNCDLPPGLSSMEVDVEDGVRRGMDHLFALGHRRIGLVSEVFETRFFRQIRHAYEESFRTYGYERRPEWIQESGRIREGGKAPTEALLALPDVPTAILATAERVAYGVIQTLQSRGLGVPQDVSVISLSSDIAYRPLPLIERIECNITFFVRSAVKMLLERVANPAIPPVKTMMGLELVHGETCGPVRGAAGSGQDRVVSPSAPLDNRG